MRTSSRDVVCVIFDEFELYDLAAFCQALSAAGKHWNWKPYRLHVVSDRASPRSTSTLAVASQELECSPQAEILFVPGGYGARLKVKDPRFVEFLAGQVAGAEWVVSVAQGSLLVGSTGLTQETTFALSPAHAELMRTELGPQLSRSMKAEPGPVSCSGKFISSASTSGSLDAALETIEKTLGSNLCLKVKQDLGLLAPPLRF